MPKKKENNKKKRSVVAQLFMGVLDAVAIILMGLVGSAIFIYASTPSGNLNTGWRMAQTTTLYDNTGEHVLYEIHGEENRKVVEHDEISDYVRLATIAAEDDAFYSHFGIDPKSIVRAFVINLENESISQGASTITQQLARWTFLTREKTFKRKVKEVFVAFKLEKNHTKEDILDYYLNTVPYGANTYGIQSASEIYFGKDADELELDEAALLAALPKAPTALSPYGKNKQELIDRKKAVIERMATLGYITSKQADYYAGQDTLAKVNDFKNSIDAPHFVFHVLEELEDLYGRDLLEVGGFEVVTTLDHEMQEMGEKVLEEGVDNVVERYGGSNASLIAINPKNGEILSMVGSKDYFNDSIDGQVNVSTRLQQPGSSFKPIVYAAAFEKGFQPESRVNDTKTNFGPDGSGRPYIPRNYDDNFLGNISVREALATSRNIPAVKMLEAVGIESTLDMAERLGIKSLTRKDIYGLSLAIGGGDITLLEGTGAFAVFANDGVRVPPTSIKKILDSDDKIVYENETRGSRVIDQEVARKVNSVLSDNEARSRIFGENSPLYIPGKTVAAKTGTTQSYRDALTLGYTPDLAVGVWAGNNNNAPMKAGAAGTFVAAPLWNDFMAQAIRDVPDSTFIAYKKVESRQLAQKNVVDEKKDIRRAVVPPEMKKHIVEDERPRGWSKREWKKYKDSLGL